MTQTIIPETELMANQEIPICGIPVRKDILQCRIHTEMRQFCSNWARGEQEVPLDSLQNVDLYF